MDPRVKPEGDNEESADAATLSFPSVIAGLDPAIHGGN
jgi:hypothetical protein